MRPAEDDGTISVHGAFDFCKFAAMADKEGKTVVDVCGIVMAFSEPKVLSQSQLELHSPLGRIIGNKFFHREITLVRYCNCVLLLLCYRVLLRLTPSPLLPSSPPSLRSTTRRQRSA